MTTKEPYSWLKYIEKALIDLDEIPLLGHVPPFDWKTFVDKMRDLLQIPDLKIEAHNWSWQSQESIHESFGSDTTCLNIAALPLKGHASLTMSATDVNSFVSWIVQHKAGSNVLVSSMFSEGLLHFVAMEALHSAEPFSCFDGFLLRILSDQTLPSSRALVLDISLKAYNEELQCRLLLPENFRSQWLQHFSQKPKTIPLELSQTLELSCSLEVAKLAMSHLEWSKVSLGDFIPLDHSNLDLENNSGSLYFTVAQKPLYRVRIKNNGLKVLEQPVYQEDSVSMDQEHDDLLSEISDLEQEKNKSLDPIPEDIDSDQSVEVEEQLEAKEEPIAVQEESTPLEKVEMVPLNIAVEITRFKMTCEKLMQLQPGNLIELNISLEKPVDLVANGKKIATGELVRIGEMLGVQVTDIG
ncbi:MAG: hypothetical protein S4CHLAM6_03000 [Chlamydiae bacterium]|nr:hypothetical protein [Chlamydiota bacterium]